MKKNLIIALALTASIAIPVCSAHPPPPPPPRHGGGGPNRDLANAAAIVSIVANSVDIASNLAGRKTTTVVQPAPAPVVVQPAPVVVQPAPVVVQPAPVRTTTTTVIYR